MIDLERNDSMTDSKNIEQVGDYQVSVDPMDDLNCDGRQQP